MGAGAVGGYFGGVLARGGHDVTFIARGENLEAIKTRGLTVNSVTSGDFNVKPEAVAAPGGPVADLVLYCVKAYDNAQAVETIAPAVGETTVVLTLQNGLGSGDELGRRYGADRVLLGATYVDATKTSPGSVSEGGGDCNIIFGSEGGERAPQADAVMDALTGSGIDARLSDNVVSELWTKLVYICGLSGMCCIAQGSMAEVLKTPATADLTWAVMREVEAVAKASGVKLASDVVETKMGELQREKDNIVSSMKTDLDRGNPLEIDALNGAVARLGGQAGVPTPVNSFIAGCLAVPHRRAMAARE